MANQNEKKEMWVAWTMNAINRYVIPEDIEDSEELVDDMVDVATKFADSMLEEFEERFEGRRRRKKPEPEEEEEEEEEEEDER